MGSLERRLTKLEGGRERPCQICGGPHDPADYVVEWEDVPDRPDEPERCPECGRRLVHIIRWHDDQDGGAA